MYISPTYEHRRILLSTFATLEYYSLPDDPLASHYHMPGNIGDLTASFRTCQLGSSLKCLYVYKFIRRVRFERYCKGNTARCASRMYAPLKSGMNLLKSTTHGKFMCPVRPLKFPPEILHVLKANFAVEGKTSTLVNS